MSLRAKNVHNVKRSRKQVVSETKISPSSLQLTSPRPPIDIVEVTKKPTSSKLEIPEDLALIKDLESQFLRYKMLKKSKPAYYDDDEGSIESIEDEFLEGSMQDLSCFMIPEDIFA
jgi:hypothetical protein